MIVEAYEILFAMKLALSYWYDEAICESVCLEVVHHL